MKTKIKYKKFKGEKVGWFQKSSPKIVSKVHSPNQAVILRRQTNEPKIRRCMSDGCLKVTASDFGKEAFKDFLGDKNAKIIALLEGNRSVTKGRLQKKEPREEEGGGRIGQFSTQKSLG